MISHRSLPLLGGTQPPDPGAGVTLLGFVDDGERLRLDSGVLHGTSKEERGITFSDDPTSAPDGRTVWAVWVGVRAGFGGRDEYFSVVASPVRIDARQRRGFRPSTHFTDMIRAIQGVVRVEGLTPSQRGRLGTMLIAHDRGMWDRRSEALAELWPKDS